ncbi:ABC transporter ATP-binding protein [Candidatus Microgenomates bacterium]|nr:ABC transporter ATP-binding protein [Candidatus Microgenomates bacterium]
MKPIIKLSRVSKKYRRGQRLLLKQAILDFFKPQREEDFWALKDVSFNVMRGEVLGIIGANGSGKSTILKLMAEVIFPTKGEVEVNGKISPLIELGAGFHPELTGRENIYLNGTILGLTTNQIDEKFDSIVKFAQLEEFIDTAVKHYSSGMYMRLGFAIAIHVDPDILLVDEILAVGDIAFQKKCLDKMKSFHEMGVTIVIISHALDLIQTFCQRVILLQNGVVVTSGSPQKVIEKYRKIMN